MPVFPRFGVELPESARALTPQIQERMSRLDKERLEGFAFRELGRFEERTDRATPGQYFLAGSLGEGEGRSRTVTYAPQEGSAVEV